MNQSGVLTSILYSVLSIFLVMGITACPATQQESDQEQADTTLQTDTSGQIETAVSETGEATTIKLATTTSLDNSGLLGYLLPIFTDETNIAVDVIAVGTGRALELGRAGDVDVILVHAPEAEQVFIDEGYGLNRHYICQNEFVIVGPEADPAGLTDAEGIVEALEILMGTETDFVSRGDDSGTHKRELSLWEAAGLTPEGDWYIEAGQGMGAVLTMASEMLAYTLTDTGTFYAMEDNLDLVVLVSGDELLENVYSIIPLNPEIQPDLKHDEVAVLVDWITSEETGELIGGFEVNGHVLFEVR